MTIAVEREIKEETSIPLQLYAYAGSLVEDGDYEYVSASVDIPTPRRGRTQKLGVYKLVRIIEVQGEARILSDVTVD